MLEYDNGMTYVEKFQEILSTTVTDLQQHKQDFCWQ